MTEMTGRDVSRFLDLVDEHQVRIWLDGGWAVDACLGRQTRQHDDLDIVIEEKDLA
jgi:lincosamide nucleotidyltransferase A/C/D/E